VIFENIVSYEVLQGQRRFVYRYDTIAEFNVDSTGERYQLNLAHVTRKKYKTRNMGQSPT